MKEYHELLQYILDNGIDCDNRTGVRARSIFGYQMKFNLQDGFPAITTKKLQFKACVAELLWFLEGSTDERRLAELTYGKNREELIGKTTIWTANADSQGRNLGYTNNDLVKELGPIYGSQWRKFDGEKDQIIDVLSQLKTDPNSRRIILSAWNPNQLHEQALPPCHYAFQAIARKDELSGMLTMRSNDTFLGTPFNIASYALLIHILSREINMKVGDLIYSIGDAHIYHNHFDQVKEQLSREAYSLPTLEIDDNFNLIDGLKNGFNLDDANMFRLKNYLYHPTIKGGMAV